jgi:hypothetical protein
MEGLCSDTTSQIEYRWGFTQLTAKIKRFGGTGSVSWALTWQVLVNFEKNFSEARAEFSHECSDSPLLER